MFTLHGTQKLFGFPASGKPAQPLDAFMTFGGILELVLGLMVMLGLFAGFAVFLPAV
jgi:putative oxidoreductase